MSGPVPPLAPAPAAPPDPAPVSAPVSTPCRRLCALDPRTGLCTGCGRTGAEIAAWAGLAEAERLRIMARLPRRLSQRLPKRLPVPPNGA
jgi:uncharacterized protein